MARSLVHIKIPRPLTFSWILDGVRLLKTTAFPAKHQTSILFPYKFEGGNSRCPFLLAAVFWWSISRWKYNIVKSASLYFTTANFIYSEVLRSSKFNMNGFRQEAWFELSSAYMTLGDVKHLTTSSTLSFVQIPAKAPGFFPKKTLGSRFEKEGLFNSTNLDVGCCNCNSSSVR